MTTTDTTTRNQARHDNRVRAARAVGVLRQLTGDKAPLQAGLVDLFTDFLHLADIKAAEGRASEVQIIEALNVAWVHFGAEKEAAK